MCSFFSNPILEFCLSTPAFSSIILFLMFVYASDKLKIPVHCSGTGYTLKQVICPALARTFSLIRQFSLESEHTKPIIWALTSLIVKPAITFMSSDWQIPGWPQFFQQQLFLSVPSLVDFNGAIIFGSFPLDFLCANVVTPVNSYPLFSNLPCARRDFPWKLHIIAVLRQVS